MMVDVPSLFNSLDWSLRSVWCFLCRLFAELVVLYLQEVLAGLLLAPADSEPWLQALPPPLFPGNDGTGKAICLKGDALLSAVVSSKVCHHRQLPGILQSLS